LVYKLKYIKEGCHAVSLLYLMYVKMYPILVAIVEYSQQVFKIFIES